MQVAPQSPGTGSIDKWSGGLIECFQEGWPDPKAQIKIVPAGLPANRPRSKESSKFFAKAWALQICSETGENLLKNVVSGATIPLFQITESMGPSAVQPRRVRCAKLSEMMSKGQG